MQPDRTTREPSTLAAIAYSLGAGICIAGSVALTGELLDGWLALGAQAAVFVALILVLGRACDPVLRWLGEPWRGGRDAA